MYGKLSEDPRTGKMINEFSRDEQIARRHRKTMNYLNPAAAPATSLKAASESQWASILDDLVWKEVPTAAIGSQGQSPLTEEGMKALKDQIPTTSTEWLHRTYRDITAELQRASKFPGFNSAHEGYGVLLEEMDELKLHVWTNQKKRDLAAMRAEAIQVAAMAIKFVQMLDEGRGRK